LQSDFDATRFYDEVAHIYDSASHPAIMDPTGQYQRGWAAIVASLKPRRILEIGCGTGRRLRPLVMYYDSIGLDLPEIVGVDPAARMLAAVPRDIASRVQLVETADTSGFEDNGFDLVYTSGVLCSVPNAIAVSVATEAVRLTRSFVFHTDTPKDGPHLSDLDILGFHHGSGADLVYWSTIYPYPMPGEAEHQIIVRKSGPTRFPTTFPIRSAKTSYDESWQALLARRLSQ
jgi:SAM-dependent methyltransferase